MGDHAHSHTVLQARSGFCPLSQMRHLIRVAEEKSQDSNLELFDFKGQGLATKIKLQELAAKWKTLEGNRTPKRLLAVIAEA